VIVWRDEVNEDIRRGLRQDGTFVVGWVVRDIVTDCGAFERSRTAHNVTRVVSHKTGICSKIAVKPQIL